MSSRICWLLSLAGPAAVLTLTSLAPTPARADFFDGLRQTFTQDIPHFFQDDIPCAFGGQPTSGTRTSCHVSDQAAVQYQPPPPPPVPLAAPPSEPPPVQSVQPVPLQPVPLQAVPPGQSPPSQSP